MTASRLSIDLDPLQEDSHQGLALFGLASSQHVAKEVFQRFKKVVDRRIE